MNDFLDSVRHLIALMGDVLDPMSRCPSIDERIIAAMKRWLNSIKAMQRLMIDVPRPMGHHSSLEVESSTIESDYGRILTANRRLATGNPRIVARPRGNETTERDLRPVIASASTVDAPQ
jgi:hypothetical protein